MPPRNALTSDGIIWGTFQENYATFHRNNYQITCWVWNFIYSHSATLIQLKSIRNIDECMQLFKVSKLEYIKWKSDRTAISFNLYSLFFMPVCEYANIIQYISACKQQVFAFMVKLQLKKKKKVLKSPNEMWLRINIKCLYQVPHQNTGLSFKHD